MLLRKIVQQAQIRRVWYGSQSSGGGNSGHRKRVNNQHQQTGDHHHAGTSNSSSNNNISQFIKAKVIKSSNSIIPKQQFSLFEDEIAYRREQASRTILFKFHQDANKQNLIKNLVQVCHGANHRIRNIFTLGVDDANALFEFELIESVTFIMNKTSHFQNVHRVPSTTRFLFYDHRACSYTPPKNNSATAAATTSGDAAKNGANSAALSSNPEHAIRSVIGCNEQIHQFYHLNRIDELSYRMRFFLASIIEEPFRGIFRNCFCIPFGSSLNLTGAKASDLDLALYLEEFPWKSSQHHMDQQNNNSQQTEGIFRFLTKKSKSVMDDRGQARFYFDLLEFLIREVLPGFELSNVIKFAKVPIIKFSFAPIKLECDLSMSNLNSSYNTTKLLWLFNRFDERVGPLIFLVKYWAKLTGIHHPVPGSYITNYQLTSLVIYYLQKIRQPVLIDVDTLIEKIPDAVASSMHLQGGEESHLKVKIKDNLSVNELRFKFRARNTMHLGDLFAGFCAFYADFDFDNRTVYLTSASRLAKSSQFKKFSLHIENFLDPSDSFSKNVSRKELDYFQQTCHSTLETLKKLSNHKPQRGAANSSSSSKDQDVKFQFNLISFFDQMRSLKRTANQLDHSDSLVEEFNK